MIITNVDSIEYYGTHPNSVDFLPIPELRLDSALIALIFLSAKGVRFLEPVDDDWYSAHLPGPPGWISNSNMQFPLYYADHPANVLGCVTRRQICNPVSGHCSPLGYEIDPNVTWSSKEQEKTFNFWINTTPWMTTLDVPDTMRTSSLKARSNFYEGVQGPLPSDQWQQEVLSWESITLANGQRMAVEAVAGPSDPSVQQYVQKNATGYFCVDQKIRSTAYTCFSVLGLTITLVLGGLIIMVSYFVEPFCALFKRRRKNYTYKRLEWVTNETLQLQGMVHEELGLGTWIGTSSNIPVTEKNENLGVLDVSNKEHPIMTRPIHSSEKPDGAVPSPSNTNSSFKSSGGREDPPISSAMLPASASFNGQPVHVEEIQSTLSYNMPLTSPDVETQPDQDRWTPSTTSAPTDGEDGSQQSPQNSPSPPLELDNRLGYPKEASSINEVFERELHRRF